LSFDVRPPHPGLLFNALSGGNQQKALVAKWQQTNPKLMMLHEPTQGVDVGARQQIATVLRTAASNGASIICSSTDADQLATLCDRVLVFARGRIIAELMGDQMKGEHIREHVLNSASRQATDPLGERV
jgi:ribose transport system ATP-binding protein